MHSQRREHLDCGNHRPISLLSIRRKLMEDFQQLDSFLYDEGASRKEDNLNL